MAETFHFVPGTTPLIVSLPHGSTHIPAQLARRMTNEALAVPDTDWHVERLYDFATDLGAALLAARNSRYVADLNRDPEGTPLYPGADNTELCPLLTFEQQPIYRPGENPSGDEIATRIRDYWQPYHARLAQLLSDTRDRHGVAVLFDGHTIRSRVPRFFTGELPDLNLGTARGASAAPQLGSCIFDVLQRSGFSAVRDERFTGGYITRRYGDPARGIHVLQLELTWRTYMDEEPPFRYLPERADRLKAVLRRMLAAGLDWAAGPARQR